MTRPFLCHPHVLLIVCFVLQLPLRSQISSGPTQDELNRAGANSADWLTTNHGYAGQRFVDLKTINPANVASLRPICLYQMPELAPTQTSPLVYRGTIYFSSTHYTVAVSATDCHLKWTHVWKPKGAEPYNTQRGVAIKDGLVIRGTADGSLFALNADTGQLAWSRIIADASQGEFLSMPPLAYENEVIIGAAGSETAAKGWVAGLNLKTGEPIWKFNTVPNVGEPGSETWGNNAAALAHGGGSVWTPLSLELDRGLVYVAVGNPAPDFYDDQRPGPNLYTNSLLALDAKAGKLAWYFQAVPHDVHDWDLTQVSPLIDSSIEGRNHRLVSVAGKDGRLRLVDRETHTVLHETEFSPRINAEEPIAQGVHYCPGALGGLEWNSPAYNPGTNLLYVPSSDWCTSVKKSERAPLPGQGMYLGAEVGMDPWDKARGSLTAIDVATGKVRWRYSSEKPMVAAVTTTSAGLVFTGETTGYFLAFDAVNGNVLFRFPTGGPVPGGVVTYGIGGKQYIGVMTGQVSRYFAFQRGTPIEGGTPTLILFALPEPLSLNTSSPLGREARP